MWGPCSGPAEQRWPTGRGHCGALLDSSSGKHTGAGSYGPRDTGRPLLSDRVHACFALLLTLSDEHARSELAGCFCLRAPRPTLPRPRPRPRPPLPRLPAAGGRCSSVSLPLPLRARSAACTAAAPVARGAAAPAVSAAAVRRGLPRVREGVRSTSLHEPQSMYGTGTPSTTLGVQAGASGCRSTGCGATLGCARQLPAAAAMAAAEAGRPACATTLMGGGAGQRSNARCRCLSLGASSRCASWMALLHSFAV